MNQLALFDVFADSQQEPRRAPRLPAGLDYVPNWLSADDEAELTALFATLPFANATYKAYTARRRVVAFGGRFDYDLNRLLRTAPLIPALVPLRDRVARWAGVAPERLVHALVSEYAPGTPLGWHRDVPDFEDVFGLSIGAAATLRFRPYVRAAEGSTRRRRDEIVRLVTAPRSLYAMRGPARWDWQHCVAPVVALRWSITFRTARTERVVRRSDVSTEPLRNV